MNLIKRIDKISNEIDIIDCDDTRMLTKNITGPRNLVYLPLNLTEELACVLGMILGDGHLKKNEKKIVFEEVTFSQTKLFKEIIDYIFSYDQKIKRRIDKRKNRKVRYNVQINSTCIYLFFNKILEVPIGKKSNVIRVPSFILENTKEIQKSFLMGVLLTDGGKHNKGYGLSTASEEFRDNIMTLLYSNGIKCYLDGWENEKYKRRYYGLYFKKKEISKIMQGCQSGLMGQIHQEFNKKFLAGG